MSSPFRVPVMYGKVCWQTATDRVFPTQQNLCDSWSENGLRCNTKKTLQTFLMEVFIVNEWMNNEKEPFHILKGDSTFIPFLSLAIILLTKANISCLLGNKAYTSIMKCPHYRTSSLPCDGRNNMSFRLPSDSLNPLLLNERVFPFH